MHVMLLMTVESSNKGALNGSNWTQFTQMPAAPLVGDTISLDIASSTRPLPCCLEVTKRNWTVGGDYGEEYDNETNPYVCLDLSCTMDIGRLDGDSLDEAYRILTENGWEWCEGSKEIYEAAERYRSSVTAEIRASTAS